MSRIIYLLYYLKGLDRSKFSRFSEYVLENYEFSRTSLYRDVLESVFRHNISLLDYFYFRFFEKDQDERSSYAGTGYMYEYQLKMNPKSTRSLLENKIQFLSHYKDFVGHRYFKISGFDFKAIKEKAAEEKVEKVILKSSDGQCGEGIKMLDFSQDITPDVEGFDFAQYDLLEEFIVQHKDLAKLSPSGLNTIRIFTQINQEGKVDLIGCRLRISVNSHVDNLAAGNMAAPIDNKSGLVTGPGVYSDITKKSSQFHPITGSKIEGFQVPFWTETLKLVKSAALFDTSNKSVGWDVAITEKGPFLLEGNHNWCKLLWQLPVKKGLKNKLKTYLV